MKKNFLTKILDQIKSTKIEDLMQETQRVLNEQTKKLDLDKVPLGYVLFENLPINDDFIISEEDIRTLSKTQLSQLATFEQIHNFKNEMIAILCELISKSTNFVMIASLLNAFESVLRIVCCMPVDKEKVCTTTDKKDLS